MMCSAHVGGAHALVPRFRCPVARNIPAGQRPSRWWSAGCSRSTGGRIKGRPARRRRRPTLNTPALAIDTARRRQLEKAVRSFCFSSLLSQTAPLAGAHTHTVAGRSCTRIAPALCSDHASHRVISVLQTATHPSDSLPLSLSVAPCGVRADPSHIATLRTMPPPPSLSRVCLPLSVDAPFSSLILAPP